MSNDPQLHELTAALHKSEQRYEAVFNQAAVGIAQIGLDGSWLDSNGRTSEILGYSIDELKKRTVSDTCHPDEAGRHWPQVNRLLAGEISSYGTDKRLMHKEGGIVWVNMQLSLVRDDSGAPQYFIAALQDIRERKQVEEELRESEEKFSKIFRLAPVGITISTIADGKFIDINEAGEKLSGYRREEVIGRYASEFNIWKEPAERAHVIAEVFEKGEVRDREMTMKDKAGRVFCGMYSALVVEIHGEKHLVSVVIDINERKRAEQALHESEERYRLLTDLAPVMIWETGPDARCTFLNKRWLEYTGKQMEQALGYGWVEDVHPDDRESCLESYHSALNARQSFTLEYRLRRADGCYGWIADTGVPRLDPSGELLGYIGTCFDISDRKLAGEELQQDNMLLAQKVAQRTAELGETIDRLQDEIRERVSMGQALHAEITERVNVEAELRDKELLLIHQSRLAAMGEMIGNIAHQWRQPLNLLGLLAQDLTMTFKKGDFRQEYLEAVVRRMMETIRHMSQTIDDFRNFFRPFKDKIDFRVSEIVEKTISLLDASFKSLQIETEVLPSDDPVVSGYPNEFSQVILNIMINARDAFVENKVEHPRITVEIRTEGSVCVVTVTDNAGGIAEEIMERIFDPYFSTKGPERGTGVGLFMSKTIIEKNMGGRLTARNVGPGAQFRIEL